ncbi:MAG: VWA domain-containing protein [Xanthobacteraceae bacterium]|nr:VWA domain-containing protein [Xanthobacteraceae bacterium]
MRENLHRFFRAARGAGVHVSPAESIDAMRAVAAVGFDNRTVLRDTLLLTLAKSEDEKRSLGECFDLFFDQPDLADAPPENAETDARGEGEEGAGDQPGSPPMPGAPQDGLQDGQQGGGQQEPQQGDQQPSAAGGGVSSELGPLARMLLSGDRATLAAALANAANAAQLSNIRYFTQRGIFSTRILNELGIERLRDDLDRLTETRPGEAERLAAATEALRDTVRDQVNQALLLYGREESENLRNEILRNAPLARIEPRQVEEMRALIRRIARRLRERYSKPRKRQRRGHLDVRRTLRRNAAWGGVPFLTAWKRKHRDRPKIVALCDVSGSVARVSDFFLLLIHSLHEVVDDVRSFAFSGDLIEVSDILETMSPEEAMREIMAKVGFGSSDYGNSFVDFEKGWLDAVTPQTTVIVLGDARSNNLDPRADILRTIGERAKRLVWLNPENRMAWGWGDSEMPRYATFCTVVRQCATARQLERAVSDIVASYQ